MTIYDLEERSHNIHITENSLPQALSPGTIRLDGKGGGVEDWAREGVTHIRLNHLRALVADSRYEVEDIHLLLQVHHVHHGIDDDEGARPAHARAAGSKKDATP